MRKVIPGIRPPLSKGMFVEVSIAGRVQPGRIVVPRNAIRNDQAYVLNQDNRLDIRRVERLFDQGDYSVIGGGLEPGEKLILTDIVPAVEDMLLHEHNSFGEGE